MVGIDEVETCPAGFGRGNMLWGLVGSCFRQEFFDKFVVRSCMVGELALGKLGEAYWYRQTCFRQKIIVSNSIVSLISM